MAAYTLSRRGTYEAVGNVAMGMQNHEVRPGALANIALSNRVDDINKHCLEEFRKHWQCLDDNNHQLWQCRKPEWKLNKCVFDNLVCRP